MQCKFCDDFTGICPNPECPMRGDCCPVPDMAGVCRFESREEERYELTPKGCAVAALMAAGLTDGKDKSVVETFWDTFTELMMRYGYAPKEETKDESNRNCAAD